MRLWSIHPNYLDATGIVALWRESLLARAVLQGSTRGYRNHPQRVRFRETEDPQAAIACYLRGVCDESKLRSYHFDETKIPDIYGDIKIAVGTRQAAFEWGHLMGKLKERDPRRHESYKEITAPDVHPMFYLVAGDVAPWEKGAGERP